MRRGGESPRCRRRREDGDRVREEEEKGGARESDLDRDLVVPIFFAPLRFFRTVQLVGARRCKKPVERGDDEKKLTEWIVGRKQNGRTTKDFDVLEDGENRNQFSLFK